MEESLKWIQNNECALIDTALIHWERTRERRIKSHRATKTLSEIYEDYKLLKQPDAYNLITSDFSSLKLTNNSLTEKSWKTLIDAALIVCKNNHSEAVKRLRQLIRTDDLSTGKIIIFFITKIFFIILQGPYFVYNRRALCPL